MQLQTAQYRDSILEYSRPCYEVFKILAYCFRYSGVRGTLRTTDNPRKWTGNMNLNPSRMGAYIICITVLLLICGSGCGKKKPTMGTNRLAFVEVGGFSDGIDTSKCEKLHWMSGGDTFSIHIIDFAIFEHDSLYLHGHFADKPFAVWKAGKLPDSLIERINLIFLNTPCNNLTPDDTPGSYTSVNLYCGTRFYFQIRNNDSIRYFYSIRGDRRFSSLMNLVESISTLNARFIIVPVNPPWLSDSHRPDCTREISRSFGLLLHSGPYALLPLKSTIKFIPPVISLKKTKKYNN